jgi:very-short-patch-repair endonuclease
MPSSLTSPHASTAQRVVVETDGHEVHGTRAAFEAEVRQGRTPTMLGYRVVRFTHRRLVYDPPTVVTTLRALLAAVAA